MNSNIIQKRQNEEWYLKIQYAARKCFNDAEILNYFVWIACLISVFSVFLPSSLPEYILVGVPSMFDIAAASFTYLASKKVTLASELRKVFDSYVLDLNTEQSSEIDYKLKEKVTKICSRNPEKTAIQLANSGNDSPPGVRDWYVFLDVVDGLKAQLECQRQNTWWDKKLSTIRYTLFCACGVIFIAVFFSLAYKKGVLFRILCSAGLILRFVERIMANYNYIRVSKLIDGSLFTTEAHPTIEGINVLQNLINQRRAINVLGMNLIHKIMAKKFTNLYKSIITK